MFKMQTGRSKPYYPLTRREEMRADEVDTLMSYIEKDPSRVFEPIHDGTFNGASLFEWVIGEGHHHAVSDRIFKFGMELDGASSVNECTQATPLHGAAKYGRLEMLRTLLRADPYAATMIDSENQTPLTVLLNSKWEVTANPELYLALHEAAPQCFSAVSGDPAWMLYRAVCSRMIPSAAVVRLFMDALDASGGRVPQGLIVDAVHRIEWMGGMPQNGQHLEILSMLVEAYPSNLMGVTQNDTPIKAMLRSKIWQQGCDIICRMAELCPESTKAGEGYDHSALSLATNLGAGVVDASRIAAVLLAVDPDVFVGDAPLLDAVREAFPPEVLGPAVAAYAARRRLSAVLAFETRLRVARSRYEAWNAAQTA